MVVEVGAELAGGADALIRACICCRGKLLKTGIVTSPAGPRGIRMNDIPGGKAVLVAGLIAVPGDDGRRECWV